jgi:hypothetical protein
MRLFNLSALIIIFSLIACSVKKETVSNQLPTQTPPKKVNQLTEEEKNEMVQMEYKPEMKPKMSPAAMNQIALLAEEKANLVCKKNALQKRSESGEQIDPSEFSIIDSLIEEIDKRLSGYSKEPDYLTFFDQKFKEYLKACSQ